MYQHLARRHAPLSFPSFGEEIGREFPPSTRHMDANNGGGTSISHSATKLASKSP